MLRWARSRRWFLAVVTATLVVALVTGPRSGWSQRVGDIGHESTNVWHRQGALISAASPPDRPASALVELGSLGGSPLPSQEGTLVYYDWLTDGHASSYEKTAPFAWPPIVRGALPVTVRFAAEAAPHSVQMRFYGRVDGKGLPEGRVAVRACELSGVPGTACAITQDSKGWQVVANGLPAGEYYLAVSAVWFVPSSDGSPPSEPGTSSSRASEAAAWLFHLSVGSQSRSL